MKDIYYGIPLVFKLKIGGGGSFINCTCLKIQTWSVNRKRLAVGQKRMEIGGGALSTKDIINTYDMTHRSISFSGHSVHLSINWYGGTFVLSSQWSYILVVRASRSGLLLFFIFKGSSNNKNQWHVHVFTHDCHIYHGVWLKSEQHCRRNRVEKNFDI